MRAACTDVRLTVLLLQQWRLIPYLAAAYALEHFTKSFFLNFVEFQMGQMMKDKSDRQVRNCGCEQMHHFYPSFVALCMCVCVPGRAGQRDPCHELLQ